MTTLAISTSSPALSLALLDGDAIIGHDHRIIGRGHAEALMPAIIALMCDARADAIIVDIGPGSFTGIRIGIAAARALGLAWGVPVTGCTAGALVAAAHGVPARVRLDAGRGQILVQDFAGDFTSGAIAIIPGDGDAVSYPDAAFVRYLPSAARGLAPAALYVRPPDAVLPL